MKRHLTAIVIAPAGRPTGPLLAEAYVWSWPEVRHATRCNSDEKASAPVPHAWRWAEQYRYGMAIRVECYAGYRGEQEPLAFWLGERRLAVRAVVDRWLAPTQRWFKVDADDGNMYVLRHDEASGDWELAAYRAGRLMSPRVALRSS